MVRDGRTAQRHPLCSVPNVEFRAGQKLDQVLAHRISDGGEQVAADGQVLAERAHLWIERTGVDQTADVLLDHQWNALKHFNILAQ